MLRDIPETFGTRRRRAVPAGRFERTTQLDSGVRSMQPIGRAVRFGAAIGVLLFGGAQLLAGQGINSAAGAGRVTSEGRGTVENGIGALIATTPGARQQTP